MEQLSRDGDRQQQLAAALSAVGVSQSDIEDVCHFTDSYHDVGGDWGALGWCRKRGEGMPPLIVSTRFALCKGFDAIDR
jgi:hypothetical protein